MLPSNVAPPCPTPWPVRLRAVAEVSQVESSRAEAPNKQTNFAFAAAAAAVV